MLHPEASRKLARALAQAQLSPEQRIEIMQASITAVNISDLPPWIQNLMASS
jgi:hypothetical protein